MTDAKATITLPPEKRAPPREAPEPDQDGASRGWFDGAVPGARPAFRTKAKIGMG